MIAIAWLKPLVMAAGLLVAVSAWAFEYDDFTGAAAPLTSHANYVDARTGYVVGALRLDGAGNLAANNATNGGFSVPDAFGVFGQTVQLTLLPSATDNNVVVRILTQTLASDSRYYGWQFTANNGGIYTRMTWFYGASSIREINIESLGLSVSEPVVMQISVSYPSSNTATVVASASQGAPMTVVDTLTVVSGSGTVDNANVPFLRGRNPGMLFGTSGGNSNVALIDLFAYEQGNDERVIILDNGTTGTSSTGNWQDATVATEFFGTVSAYAEVGGVVDSYRFTPDIPSAAGVDVFVWNSCFNIRPDAVPHLIVHATGSDTVYVDQNCDTGTSGEWEFLGNYYFEAGTSGYLEISDEGIVSGTTSYIGADAVRFESESWSSSTAAEFPQLMSIGPVRLNLRQDVNVGSQLYVRIDWRNALFTQDPILAFPSTQVVQGGAGSGFAIFQWISEDELTSNQGWDVEIGDISILEDQCLVFTYSVYGTLSAAASATGHIARRRGVFNIDGLPRCDP